MKLALAWVKLLHSWIGILSARMTRAFGPRSGGGGGLHAKLIIPGTQVRKLLRHVVCICSALNWQQWPGEFGYFVRKFLVLMLYFTKTSLETARPCRPTEIQVTWVKNYALRYCCEKCIIDIKYVPGKMQGFICTQNDEINNLYLDLEKNVLNYYRLWLFELLSTIIPCSY